MPPLVKRIVVNGLLTAAMLGGIGFLLAELGSAWLSGATPARTSAVERTGAAAPAEDPAAAVLRARLPLTLAAWGFGFILVGELVLYAWRGEPKPKAVKKPYDAGPDPAEALLEQLLAEADAAAQRSEVRGQKSEVQTAEGPKSDAACIVSADR